MGFKYRVPGFGVPDLTSNKSAKNTTAIPGSMSPKEMVRFVAQLLGPVYLSDELYFSENLDLHRFWPTFSFLKRSSTRGQIKIQPVALADYLPITGISPEHELAPVWSFCEAQVSEILAIRAVLSAFEKNEYLKIEAVKTPIAAAFAGYFFRGSIWFNKNHATLLEKVRLCPWASYIALSAGLWPTASIGLIKSICDAPRLAVELFTHPIMHSLVQIDCLPAIVADNPHLELVAAGNMKADDEVFENFWDRFVDHANTAPMAAAFCLALTPSHKNAKSWLKLIGTSNRATYWCALAFRKNNQMEDFCPLVSLYEKVLDIPQWDYHFVKEMDRHAAVSRARRIWPDPWAIEMIEDLKLPFEDFRDLYEHSMSVDYISKEFKDSLTLWAADYNAEIPEPWDEKENDD